MKEKEIILKAIAEKKGKDITVLKVEHLTVVADYFIIANARSAPQVKAIADNIDEKMSKEGIEPLRRDGVSEGRWIVLDYGSIIVHIFNDETRLLYALDRLWSDGSNTEKYAEEESSEEM